MVWSPINLLCDEIILSTPLTDSWMGYLILQGVRADMTTLTTSAQLESNREGQQHTTLHAALATITVL